MEIVNSEKGEGIHIQSANKEMSDVEKAKEAWPHMVNFVHGDVLPELHKMFTTLQEAKPCRQFQCILQDIMSIKQHLVDLATNGAKPAFVEVPLEDSVVAEEEPTQEVSNETHVDQ